MMRRLIGVGPVLVAAHCIGKNRPRRMVTAAALFPTPNSDP